MHRGELTVCSVETQELQSNGNFIITLFMHRRKKSDLNKAFTVYFRLYKLFSVTPPSMYSMRSFQKMNLNFTQNFKDRKIRKSYIQSIQSPLLFFLFLWLLPTFFIEEDEQDSRKLEEAVKDRELRHIELEKKMKMTKWLFEKQKMEKRTSRIQSFKRRQIKYIPVTLKNIQQVAWNLISVCSATWKWKMFNRPRNLQCTDQKINSLLQHD